MAMLCIGSVVQLLTSLMSSPSRARACTLGFVDSANSVLTASYWYWRRELRLVLSCSAQFRAATGDLTSCLAWHDTCRRRIPNPEAIRDALRFYGTG